jgi:hypothetical protein
MNINQLVGQLTSAWAIAEGYTATHDIPWNQKNPGDLTAGSRGNWTPNGKMTYTLHSSGWLDLEDMARTILTGGSTLYPLTITFGDMAKKYTGESSWCGWLRAVCQLLDVQPTDTIDGWKTKNTK